MTTTVPPPRLLLVSTALLAGTGIALLGMPHGQQPPAPATSPTAQATADPSSAPSAVARKPAVATAPSARPTGSTPSVVESALPPHGEGVAGDWAIQRSLEAAWPADLPAADERELLTAGRALLRADATGIGRAQWPAVFPALRQGLAPAFATARFRIQAAIARRDGGPDTAVVHLVWAGTDRGGTFADGRITDWHFTRSTLKGTAPWTAQPRI